SERTGPSRTPCTGSWTWSFATTNAASEPTTLRPISQPAGTSPTISPERPRARTQSASAEKPQAGTTNISPVSSQREFLHPIPLDHASARRREDASMMTARRPRTGGLFVRHQALVGLSGGGSELARRVRRLL